MTTPGDDSQPDKPILRYPLPKRPLKPDVFTWFGTVLAGLLAGFLILGGVVAYQMQMNGPRETLILVIGACLLVTEILSILFRSSVAAMLGAGGLLFMLILLLPNLFSVGGVGDGIALLLISCMAAIALVSHVRWVIQIWRYPRMG